MGRRTAASWVRLPPGGLSSQDAPPISLLSRQKRNGPCTVQREKRQTRSGAVALRADGSRRIGACVDLALPSGTLRPSAVPVTAVPWRMVRRLSGWLSHCLCTDFRCRWPVVDESCGMGQRNSFCEHRAARSSCAAVGGSAAYGCGVPLAGKAERAEGGTSGTLVTEILGAPQRETVKEELVKCVLATR